MNVNATDFECFDAYCDALRRCEWLTPDEFAALLSQSIAYGEESYHECRAQFDSETAMFGDAGPGQGVALHSRARMLAEDRARLARVRRIAANLSA